MWRLAHEDVSGGAGPGALQCRSRPRGRRLRAQAGLELEPDRDLRRRPPRLVGQPERRHGVGHPHRHEHRGPPHHHRRRAPERRAEQRRPPRLRRQRAAGSVAVIRIFDRAPRALPRRRRAAPHDRAPSRGTSSSRPTAGAPSSPTAARTRSRSSTRTRERIIGDVNLRTSRCDDPDRATPLPAARPRRDAQQPRLYVTSFLVVHPRRRQAGRRQRPPGRRLPPDDQHASRRIRDYRPAQAIPLAPQVTGFTVDSNGDGTPDPTSAFPNQLQSIVIRGNRPTCPTSPPRPTGRCASTSTRRRSSTSSTASTACSVRRSAAKFLNLHLGARNPEPGKKKLFFANAWAIGFTTQCGRRLRPTSCRPAATCSSSSTSRPTARCSFTGRSATRRATSTSTTRPTRSTAGANAGKNPQGIAINTAGTRAYVQNFVSRNVSVVDLDDRQGHQGRSAPRPCRRPARRPSRSLVGRRDVLLARAATSTGRRGARCRRRAAVERGLAELRELPLQGPDRRRRLGLRRRPAQVRAAQRRRSTRATARSSGS